MRELMARIVCALTLGVVIALSLVFAGMHNPESRIPTLEPMALSEPLADRAVRPVGTPASQGERVPSPSAAAASPRIERGLVVYEQQNCATCHSIAGEGNPRNPLDGVGSIWNEKEMEEWITGGGSVADALPSAIVKRKQRYQSMPRADLDALIAYLKTLK